MLQRAPWRAEGDAVHRLGIPDSAKQMIDRYEQRSRWQHSPVPIARQKRQRAEDVEVRLNSSARQMD